MGLISSVSGTSVPVSPLSFGSLPESGLLPVPPFSDDPDADSFMLEKGLLFNFTFHCCRFGWFFVVERAGRPSPRHGHGDILARLEKQNRERNERTNAHTQLSSFKCTLEPFAPTLYIFSYISTSTSHHRLAWQPVSLSLHVINFKSCPCCFGLHTLS